MDYLDTLTAQAAKHATDARVDYLEGHPLKALEELDKLWNIFLDQLAGGVPTPSESAELEN